MPRVTFFQIQRKVSKWIKDIINFEKPLIKLQNKKKDYL